VRGKETEPILIVNVWVGFFVKLGRLEGEVVPPVRSKNSLYAGVGIKMRVVPVSTIAWVLDMSCFDPYSTDLMSMPQYLLKGSDVIRALKTTGRREVHTS